MLKKKPYIKDLLFLLYIAAPKNTNELKEFIINIFSDKQAIDLKIPLLLQKGLARVIAKMRIKKISSIYKNLFNGISPQVTVLANIKDKMSKLYLERTNKKLFIKYGMCYTKPFIEDAINEINVEEFDNIFVLTLYPHYSYATAGVCIERFIKRFNFIPKNNKLSIFYYWYNNKKFNELWIKNIKKTAIDNDIDLKTATLIFSAHSLPLETLKKGDLYAKHLKENIDCLVDELNPATFYLSYQSKALYGNWLKPTVLEVINEVTEKKLNNIIFVPVTFINDHIETLYEIDKLYVDLLEKKGIKAVRTPCFNDKDEFIEVLLDIITTT